MMIMMKAIDKRRDSAVDYGQLHLWRTRVDALLLLVLFVIIDATSTAADSLVVIESIVVNVTRTLLFDKVDRRNLSEVDENLSEVALNLSDVDRFSSFILNEVVQNQSNIDRFIVFDQNQSSIIEQFSNSSSMADQCELAPLTAARLWTAFAYAAIFCVSLVGNCGVILTVARRRQMRSVTNVYLLNLAIADLMRSVICMPSTLVSDLFQCWIFGAVLCKFFAYMQPVAVAASANTLVAIAIERYYAICRPLQSRQWHTHRHATTTIAIVWILSFSTNIGALVLYEQQQMEIGWNCTAKFESLILFIYQIYITVILLLIPLIMMIVLYGNIIVTLISGSDEDDKKRFGGCFSFANKMPKKKITNATIDDDMRKDSVASWAEPIERRLSQDELLAIDDDEMTKQNIVPTLNHLSLIKLQHLTIPRRSFGQIESFLSSENSRKISLATRSRRLFVMEKSGKTGDANGDCSKSNNLTSFLRKRSDSAVPTKANDNCQNMSKIILRCTNREKSLLARKRIIRMLIIIVVIFFCCWTPSFLWWLLLHGGDAFRTLNVWNGDANAIITVLTYLSSCTNPITYCFLNERFRNSFIAICCRTAKTSFDYNNSRTVTANYWQQKPSVSCVGGTQRSMSSTGVTSIKLSKSSSELTKLTIDTNKKPSLQQFPSSSSIPQRNRAASVRLPTIHVQRVD